jgi:prolyl-tRNA synthetase
MPLLIPESLLSKEKSHFEGFKPEVYWVTKAGGTELTERLALRPTSETIVYASFSKWIESYRDLPLKINFWNSALRAEIKNTKPFIRNSEFLWQEGHTAHLSEKDAQREVRLILETYQKLIEQFLAIPIIAGLKSDREKFVGAVYTMTLESLMPDGKALQLATSHHLGQNFSKPFEIRYLDQRNEQCFVWQTSWGISWRLIGAVVMTHGDDKGLVLPPRIAPIQVVIVPIFRDNEAHDVKSRAHEIGNELRNSGIKVLIDDREEYTSGWKFNEWELKGIPLRINLGPRDIKEAQVELVRRDTTQKFKISRSSVVNSVSSILREIQENLFRRAKENMSQNVTVVDSYDSFKISLGKGGFISTAWCGNQDCETRVKEETGADLRVIPLEGPEVVANQLEDCFCCKRRAAKIAIFAHAY